MVDIALGTLPPMNGCISNAVSGDGNTGHSNCGDIFELLCKDDVSSGPFRIEGGGVSDPRAVLTDFADTEGCTGADDCVRPTDANFGRGTSWNPLGLVRNRERVHRRQNATIVRAARCRSACSRRSVHSRMVRT